MGCVSFILKMANASAQAVDPAGALDLSDPKSTKFLANDTTVKYTAIKDAQVVQKKGANKGNPRKKKPGTEL